MEDMEAVRNDLREVKEKISQLEELPRGDPERVRLVALEQRQTALEQQKLLLLQHSQAATVTPSAEVSALASHVQQLSLAVQQAKQVAAQALKGQEELQLQLYKMSVTTRTYNDVGRAVRQRVRFASLQLSSVGNDDTAAACEAAIAAVLNLEAADSEARQEPGESAEKGRKRMRHSVHAAAALEAPQAAAASEAMPAAAPESEHARGSTTVQEVPESMSLEAAMRRKYGAQSKWREEGHLQPVTFAVLDAVSKRCSSATGLSVEDTHRRCGLRNPAAKPDITMLAAPLQAWTQTVGTVEIKATDSGTDADASLGQLQQCSAAVFDAQEGRSFMYSASMTMNSIEVFKFTRDAAAVTSSSLQPVTSSNLLPFSIDKDSAGFQLLVRLLATPTVDHGFLPAQVPQPQLHTHTVDNVLLLRRGSASSSSSFIYQVEASGPPGTLPEKAVLKLNKLPHEGDVLVKLRDQPYTIQLLDRGTCNFQGCLWHAILLTPFVEHLACSDSLKLLAQVTVDIACALEAAAKAGILHRDVTPNNIGHKDGRGLLLDFSAAAYVSIQQEDASAAPTEAPPASPLSGITGTLLWAAYSVLQGSEHTMSSQLEGLFLSILYISMDGHCWPGRFERRQVGAGEWGGFRRHLLGGEQLLHLEKVEEHLQPLVKNLHDLFWQPDPFFRRYRRDVKVSEVYEACKKACPPDTLALPGGAPP